MPAFIPDCRPLLIGSLPVADHNEALDLVLAATPIDLRRVIAVEKPLQRVRYEIQAIGRPNLEDVLGKL